MQANELRVGNWVTYKGEVIPVTMIGEYGIQSDYKGRLINAKFVFDDIKPIPLDHEILEKAGFERTEGKYTDKYKHPNNVFIERHKIDGDLTNAGIHGVKMPMWAVPQYLHQLQNLYHALTGQELTITI